MNLLALAAAAAEAGPCADPQHPVARGFRANAAVPWPGFYALCLGETGSVLNVGAAAADALFRTGGRPGRAVLAARLSVLAAQARAEERDATVLRSPYDFRRVPWGFFSLDGEAVGEGDRLPDGLVLAYEHGAFIHPPIAVGHVREVPVDGRRLRMETLSVRPAAFRLTGLLEPDECAAIREAAASSMRRSGVRAMDSSTGGDVDASRTSSNTFLDRERGGVTQRLARRAHNVTRLDYDLGEAIQVVRYAPGQRYEAHRDFFAPVDYTLQPSMLRMVEYGGRNRMATVFWYLNSVERGGGGTYFPRALDAAGREFSAWNFDYRDCYRGLYVPATQGDAVLFYSALPDGALDERSLHGGCPPDADTKWGANQWIWNAQQTTAEAFERSRPDACRDVPAVECAALVADGLCASAAAPALCGASCGLCGRAEL